MSKDIPGLFAKAKEYSSVYVIPDGKYSSWYLDR